jgi:hypothetical protein
LDCESGWCEERGGNFSDQIKMNVLQLQQIEVFSDNGKKKKHNLIMFGISYVSLSEHKTEQDHP